MVSTNREQIPFIPFHRLPLSCAVPRMREVLRLSEQQLRSLVSLDQRFLSGAKCSWIAQASDASKTGISKASVSQTSRKMQLHHVKSLQMRSLAFLCSDSKEGGTGRVPAPSCTPLIQANSFFHSHSRKHLLRNKPSFLLLPTPKMMLLHHPFSTSCLSSWPELAHKQYWGAAWPWLPLLHKPVKSLVGVQAASSIPSTLVLPSFFSTPISSCFSPLGISSRPPVPAKLLWVSQQSPSLSPAQKHASLSLPTAHQLGGKHHFTLGQSELLCKMCPFPQQPHKLL